MSSCREEAAPEGGEFFTFARIQTRQCCWVPSVPLRAVWSHCPPQTATTWQPAGHCRAAACFVGPLILTVPGSHPPEPGATSSRPPTLNGWGLWPALLLTPSGQSTLAVLLPLWLSSLWREWSLAMDLAPTPCQGTGRTKGWSSILNTDLMLILGYYFSLRNRHHFLFQSSLFLEDLQFMKHISTYLNTSVHI